MLFVVLRFALAGAVIAATAGCDRVFDLDRPPIDAPPPIDAALIDAPSPYAAIVLADEPIAYFRLGERDGVTAQNVLAGPTGQYVSSFTLGSPGAIPNDPDTAVSFSGDPAAVLLGDVFDFPGHSPFTIEAWIKPVFDGSFGNIVSKWNEPPMNTGYLLYCRDAVLSFARTLTPTSQELVNWTGLVTDRYTHIVGSYDGTTLRLYANGVEVSQLPGPRMLPDTTVGFVIGAGNGTQFGGPYHGEIDEVAIYDKALPGTRVFEHFAAGRP